MRWVGRIPAEDPVAVPVTTPEAKPGTAWCSGCDRWTERDPLPGTTYGGQEIPTWWFCVWCGICDFDYEEGAA